MQPQSYLGIYLSKETATVVCLGLQGRDYNLLGCFSVSVEEPEEAAPKALASLIAQGCAERELKFSEVAIALDCAMFMQHNVHSEFEEPKQIATTIRFDTEEALATDITDVAIAFKITSRDRTGSELTVFTAQRKILSDVLLSLQSNDVDPVTIEPDVNCLSRFIYQNVSLPEDSHPFFCLLSRRNGYFIVPHPSGISISSTGAGSQKTSAVRTFLLGPTQSRIELLTREVPVTAALVKTAEPVNCVKVFDSTGSVNIQTLSEKLGIETSDVDLAQSAAAGTEALADCADPVDFAIAYGAALAHLEKAQSVNFRNDFMPYQGKKVRLQKTLKFLSVSVTVLMLAVGLYFQASLWKINRGRSAARKKIAAEYSAVMLGKKLTDKANPAKELGSELRRIQNVKKGQLDIKGEESVSAKLTLVLAAFNKCAEETNLNIDSISITTKAISIAGDTSSWKNTLKLFEEIKKGGLDISQQNLRTKVGRNNFSITVALKK